MPKFKCIYLFAGLMEGLRTNRINHEEDFNKRTFAMWAYTSHSYKIKIMPENVWKRTNLTWYTLCGNTRPPLTNLLHHDIGFLRWQCIDLIYLYYKHYSNFERFDVATKQTISSVKNVKSSCQPDSRCIITGWHFKIITLMHNILALKMQIVIFTKI